MVEHTSDGVIDAILLLLILVIFYNLFDPERRENCITDCSLDAEAILTQQHAYTHSHVRIWCNESAIIHTNGVQRKIATRGINKKDSLEPRTRRFSLSLCVYSVGKENIITHHECVGVCVCGKVNRTRKNVIWAEQLFYVNILTQADSVYILLDIVESEKRVNISKMIEDKEITFITFFYQTKPHRNDLLCSHMSLLQNKNGKRVETTNLGRTKFNC